MHAIIIPHRDRNRSLKWCLLSIAESATITKTEDYIVLVVDGGSAEPIDDLLSPVQGILLKCPLGWAFNKCRLLNLGIETALAIYQADVLTFLDADAIVGSRWLEGIRCLEADGLTLLFYRVRLLAADRLDDMEKFPQSAGLIIRGLFRHDWDRCEISPECYNDPGRPYRVEPRPPPFGAHVFAHSQFSIRREVLGDLRFHEAFEGRGHEDQWFVRQVKRRVGSRYCGALLTEPEFAMLHIWTPFVNTPGDPWNTQKAMDRNKALYDRT